MRVSLVGFRLSGIHLSNVNLVMLHRLCPLTRNYRSISHGHMIKQICHYVQCGHMISYTLETEKNTKMFFDIQSTKPDRL